MTTNDKKDHNEKIIDQFTKQAIPFTELPGHLDSIQILIEMTKVNSDDCVLDVACGPGLVTCEFAKAAKKVTGIDITEKMIEQAQKRQKELGLTNLNWDIGTVLPLPYESESFTIVITRYSFHHFINPEAVLKEMCRICKKGGKVLIADAALPNKHIDAYNHMEKLRDPSHTRAFSLDEFDTLLQNSGLKSLQRSSYTVEMELEKQLKASFPNPGDDEKIRDIFRKDIGVNTLGMSAHYAGTEIHFSYPISVYTGEK